MVGVSLRGHSYFTRFTCFIIHFSVLLARAPVPNYDTLYDQAKETELERADF